MALNKKALISVAVYAGSFAIGIAAAIGVNKLSNAYHNSYKQRRKRVVEEIKAAEYDNKEQVILMACYERELKELQSQKATLAIDDPTSGEKIEIIELSAHTRQLRLRMQTSAALRTNITLLMPRLTILSKRLNRSITKITQPKSKLKTIPGA